MIPDPNLKIPEFSGVNTQSPKGTTLQPCVLENVWLGNKGGYSPMAAGSRRTALTVLSAVTTGLGQRLFLQTNTNWGQFLNGVYTILGTPGLDLSQGFAISPGTAMVPGPGTDENVYLTSRGAIKSYGASFVTYWNGVGAAPTVPYYYFEGITGTPVAPGIDIDFFAGGLVYLRVAKSVTIILSSSRTSLQTPTQQVYSNLDGFQILSVNPSAGAPPISANWVSGSTHYRVRFKNLNIVTTVSGVSTMLYLSVYHKSFYSTGVGTASKLQNSSGEPLTEWSVPESSANVSGGLPALDSYFKIGLRARTGAYFNARAWVAPSVVREYNVQSLDSVVMKETTTDPNVVMYSEVYYPSSETNPYISLPLWRAENSITIPFRVSESVIALSGVGRYLYILGEQEVFLLTGSSELDFYVESIGDSVGCVSVNTVQRLYNRLFWLSTSGLQMAQGGQISEVSADVRDLILSLNTANVSSTVDFAQDLYYLTDGTITLCFDARSGGWTTRTTDGTSQRLVFGGGVACVVATQALYSLDGKLDYLGARPGWKAARMEWEGLDLGDLWDDKTFHGLSVGADTDGAVTITDSSTVNGAAAIPQALVVASGVTALRYRWKGYKSTHLKISLKLEANVNTVRALLRPPLTVAVADMREARV